MTIGIIKLISKHPEVQVGKKKFIKLPKIAGLRFKLRTFIAPQAIRLRLNKVAIFEDKFHFQNDITSLISDYLNIWVEVPNYTGPNAQLSVELKYFGVFITFVTLNICPINQSNIEKLTSSDAFVDIASPDEGGLSSSELVKRIESLPSVVRSTKSHLLRKKIKNILVMRLDQLGDFILTIPAIVKLKDTFKDAKITALVSPSNADCAYSLNIFDQIIVVPFSFEKEKNTRYLSEEAKQIVKKSPKDTAYDLAIDLSVMPDSRTILELINAAYKVGFENTLSHMMDLGILLHAKDPINRLSNISHAAYPMLMVQAAILALRPDYAHISPSPNSIIYLKEYNILPKNYIVVHSGARNLLARWPQENFMALATKIADHGENVVFFADEELSSPLAANFNLNRIQVFCGGMSYEQFDAIISHARVYIGNDTGPKHLAAMRNVPVVSIHAARSNWSEWGQVDSGCIISRRVPCAGCGIETKNECGRDLACLNNISVEEVFDCYRSVE
jgi:ADP-heptose:LPS heptosyltransferase